MKAAILPLLRARPRAEQLRYAVCLSHPDEASGFLWSGMARSVLDAEEKARVAYLWDTGYDHQAAVVRFIRLDV